MLTVLISGSACTPAPTEGKGASAGGMSIVPASGSGSHQVFTAAFAHTGAGTLATVRVLFNHDADGRAACYVYYAPATSSFLLVNDSGEGANRLPAGGPGKLSNSQCELDGGNSSASDEQGQLKVRFDLQFKPNFHGKTKIYLYSEAADGQASGFKESGDWDSR